MLTIFGPNFQCRLLKETEQITAYYISGCVCQKHLQLEMYFNRINKNNDWRWCFGGEPKQICGLRLRN